MICTMITVNPYSNEVHFAGAASGGGTAPTALIASFLALTREDKPLAEALTVPRLIHPATPDAVFVESGTYALDTAALQQRGHKTSPV
ncbi:MAG: gamma-glutamyltransferase, partial [Candidatus Eisenbacteria bacterium]|nr:gamma-glutamyltransferase [Candidatus Eisenbacteria bacterium]